MPLFFGQRDISLFRHVSRELLSRIISEEVGYYKIALKQSKVNTYGESNSKFYYPAIILNCLHSRQEQTTNDVEYGPDEARLIEFRFLRDDLQDIQLVPERGDIIMYLNEYYEVDNIKENQYIGGKYPEYAMSDVSEPFGSSWSIVCETHHTRPTILNITKERL